MKKKPIKLQLDSSISQDKHLMKSNNGNQYFQSEISPNRINPAFGLSQCQSQKHFRVTNENCYRGSNNKTPLSKLLSIREDNHQLQVQKSQHIKLTDHSDPEGQMRFQVKSPILLKNLISQKFNQLKSKKCLNTSSKEISPTLLRSQSAQGNQSQIEKILEISKKAKYRDRLSNVEQKFLKKFVNLLNPDDPENQIYREDSQEESDQEPLQQNPFQNKIMEEQFKLQNFRLNLLSNELVNSHQFLKSKLQKQKENRDKQNLFNNFAARMIKNKKFKDQEQSSKIDVNSHAILISDKKTSHKKNYDINLFGNRENNDLSQVQKRVLAWEGRIDSQNDVQINIKPYELLKGQISHPQAVDSQQIPKVQKLIHKFKNKHCAVFNERQKIISMQEESLRSLPINRTLSPTSFISSTKEIQEQSNIIIDPKLKYVGPLDLIQLLKQYQQYFLFKIDQFHQLLKNFQQLRGLVQFFFKISQYNCIQRLFFAIIKHRQIAEIYKILKLNGRDVLWQRDSIGMTPMHWACKRADEIIIKLLLNYDAPLNAQDMFGRTPIDIALFNEKKSVKKMIRDYQRGEFEKDFQTFNYLELFGKLPDRNKKYAYDQ